MSDFNYKRSTEILIKRAVNDNVLIHVVNYLKQSGYKYNIFDSFFDENIEIIDINYTFKREKCIKI